MLYHTRYSIFPLFSLLLQELEHNSILTQVQSLAFHILVKTLYLLCICKWEEVIYYVGMSLGGKW